ncbi:MULTISPECIES: hypothetical protein [Sphingobacterium]|jgi:hypothetical protein|uniref:Uncharacterized protein n=1 Tax=Sphingobacterium litopenaei TaxID=2763500 RepID=A0ABR7YIK0_9SPHI|nr:MULTISPECIES: hypothetical protein [Sphingobacterium]MBD1431153.1 hypothetical protein [Sphingobacterium litopenaei]NGM72947.1 hypothetical protein [Sphingobacterium sp. SGL-16]
MKAKENMIQFLIENNFDFSEFKIIREERKYMLYKVHNMILKVYNKENPIEENDEEVKRELFIEDFQRLKRG